MWLLGAQICPKPVGTSVNAADNKTLMLIRKRNSKNLSKQETLSY